MAEKATREKMIDELEDWHKPIPRSFWEKLTDKALENYYEIMQKGKKRFGVKG
jgi:hypothetical protein